MRSGPTILALSIVFTTSVSAAEYGWEQAQRTQRAFDAQRALRNYTADYIKRETAPSVWSTPSRSDAGSAWGDNYTRKRRDPAPARPVGPDPDWQPGGVQYKLTQVKKDPAMPRPTPQNYEALTAHYQKHGYSRKEAEGWAEAAISVEEYNRTGEWWKPARGGGAGRDDGYYERRMEELAAESKTRRAEYEKKVTTWEREAANGDTAAMRGLATYKEGLTNTQRLELLEKAATLGDYEAMISAYETIVGGQFTFDEARANKWAQPLALAGYSKAASFLADRALESGKGDFAVLAATLEASFAAKPSFSVAERLTRLYNEGGPSLPRNALKSFQWGQAAMALPREGYSRIQAVRAMPVEPAYAPQILTSLENLSRDAGQYDAGQAAMDLATIYSGQSEAWKTLVTPNQEKAFEWSVKAGTLLPSLLPEIAKGYLDRGQAQQGERFMEQGARTNSIPAVYAAAQFWSERQDGKAQGIKAVELYKKLLPGGELKASMPDCAKLIGDIFRYGKGVPRNLPKAVEWYEYGLQMQNPLSARALAQCLFEGEGTPKNQGRALQILDEAAAYKTTDDNAPAAAFDALLLRLQQKAANQTEEGLDAWRLLWKDNVPALRKLAVGSNPNSSYGIDPRAQSILGSMLIKGELEGSKSEGWRLIETAKKRGEARAEVIWGERLLGAWEDRPRGGRTDAERNEAFQLFTYAARKGQPRAGYNLGLAYLNGWGTAPDEEKALDWLQWAEQQGHAASSRHIMELLLTGTRVKDLPRAVQLLTARAERGDIWSQNNLGVLYWLGQGVPQDTARALQLLDKAAAGGEWFAARSAAKIRMNGGPNLTAQGPDALMALEEYSAKNGAETMMLMGRLYAGDAEVNPWLKPDLEKAKQWFEKAYFAFGDDYENLTRREAGIRRDAPSRRTDLN